VRSRQALSPPPVPVTMLTPLRVNESAPLIYLITSGQTSSHTTPDSEEFSSLLRLAHAAVDARVDLLQIREKSLSTRVLYALAASVTRITRGSDTKLLINDRSDVAASAGADGVHLTTNSLLPAVVRNAFGDDFVIGVSTHSAAQALAARDGGADFVVFGPVFDTLSKQQYGEPLGLNRLEDVTAALAPFPVLALGGVTLERVANCLDAGAAGVAGISMLSDPAQLERIADQIRGSSLGPRPRKPA